MTTSLTRNHDVERIYVKSLQETESSVYYLHNMLEQTKRRIRKLHTPIEKIADPSKPKFYDYLNPMIAVPFIWMLTISLIDWLTTVVSQIPFLGWLVSDHSGIEGMTDFILAISIIFGIVGIILTIVNYGTAHKKYKEKLALTQNKNLSNIQQMKNNYADAVLLEEEQSKIELEYDKALSLRDDLYNINWIPSQYRNIQVVYYICDMVSTSNIGIEESLKYYLLQETNNKLDEVLKRLDQIIENQNEMIVNQAIMKAQNEKIIQQNTTMISKAEQIEENTRLSAEYAQVGANYSKVNAFFSAATYLKISEYTKNK